eukprot:CAMPEP_0201523482 /NCGR_PEP_ID=MMETSP0161_2-20130828/20056_1 /ASSEMBLY_ACC=CAM_ASM_000251 /TAXON_ID=180227 /ORGANISM="Neoparamoeba aestuarina, Strain SoJaBio B1-5/56/2" /LENGTH=167 /DNA_ID=CAMNT_0047922619 /DNA_START=63 /DNA_END=566 /DNA_ORIENTATION=-
MAEAYEYFFTYGTLMTGECREDCWPVKPKEVYEAKLNGTYLFDWGVGYPGMVVVDLLPPSSLSVVPPSLPKAGRTLQGEVWVYDKKDAAQITKVLDSIEGYRSDKEGSSLYLRRKGEVSIFTKDGNWKSVSASFYVYKEAKSLIQGGQEDEFSTSSPDSYVRWSASE